MNILTVAEMREIERQADAHGLSYAQMMRNAGSAAADEIWRRKKMGSGRSQSGQTPSRILVLCGPGNNGGDGLVCAAELAPLLAGGAGGGQNSLSIFFLKPRDETDPLIQAVRQRGVPILHTRAQLREELAQADVIVDALLGTGVSRPIEGALKDVLDDVREMRHPQSRLVALDGPSGMNYDTGALDPAALNADLTITFHAPKRGHFCYPAAGACGELVVADIGIPTGDGGRNIFVSLADNILIHKLLPARNPDGNKGTFGRALVVGGCAEYIGAPALAATAAYRVGAGLVSMNVPDEIKLACAVNCREATFFSGWDEGLSNARVVLVGPGLGRGADAISRKAKAVEWAISQSKQLVLDADALDGDPPRGAILTPHPGEMARMTSLSVAQVQADRFGVALRFAAQWRCVVVLKGAYTIVASPDGRAVVLPFANPALATAGTGDVLAGAVAGFCAQGLPAHDAAVCGAFVHARAGERWREAHGDAGLLASDLLALLPQEIRIKK